MGSWKRQYLVVEPGDRDVGAVAGDLRTSLAALDVEGMDNPERAVTVADGRVRWDTGERLRNDYYELPGFVDELSVPCDWLLGVRQHEHGSHGAATLYAWLDGEFVCVERTGSHVGLKGGDGLSYLESEWDIDVGLEP